MTADEKTREVRRNAAECIRQFLAGRVSCDHLIDEFGRTGDEMLNEVMGLIEAETAGFDRYAKLEETDRAFRERLEELAGRLES